MNNAKKIADEQSAADKAHHEKRIQWLSKDAPVFWSCGAPVSPRDRHVLVESPAKTMNVILPDAVLRFLALPSGSATQPARPKGQTLPVNPPSGGEIGTPECFTSSGHCESPLNSTAPEQRAVERPGTDPKGFKNHGITGRGDLYPRLRDWGVIPLRPRLGGFTAKRRGLNKKAAGRPAPRRFASPYGWRIESLRHGLNQRDRRASMRSLRTTNSCHCVPRCS